MITTYEEALSYINDFTWSKSRLGLKRTRELLYKLGDPQKKLNRYGIGKYLLRHAFEEDGLIPRETSLQSPPCALPEDAYVVLCVGRYAVEKDQVTLPSSPLSPP